MQQKWTFGAQQQQQRQQQRQQQQQQQRQPYSNQPLPPQYTQRPKPNDTLILEKDLTEDRPKWVFSCYGAPQSNTLVGHDTSFEEARVHEMGLLASGCPMEQVVGQTNNFMQQAMAILQAFLAHRRKAAGFAPQAQTAQPRWNFGRAQGRGPGVPGGRGGMMFGGGRGHRGNVPYGPQQTGGRNAPYAQSRPPPVTPSRPVAFKSSLFASPEATKAFLNPAMKAPGNGVNGAPLQPMQMQRQTGAPGGGQEPNDEMMQGDEVEGQEENVWLASQFFDKIPEDAPPDEYIKSVKL